MDPYASFNGFPITEVICVSLEIASHIYVFYFMACNNYNYVLFGIFLCCMFMCRLWHLFLMHLVQMACNDNPSNF